MQDGDLLLGLAPQREGVVGEVVVQVDQSRDDHRGADVDHRGSWEPGWPAVRPRVTAMMLPVVSSICTRR